MTTIGAFGPIDEEVPDPEHLVPEDERLDHDAGDETDTGDHDLNDQILMQVVRTEGIA